MKKLIFRLLLLAFSFSFLLSYAPDPNRNRRVVLQQKKYDPLAVNYFNRAGISNVREKNAVNTFVLRIKSKPTIWASLQGGFIYLVSPTSYGASLHNLLSSNYTLSGTAPTYATTGWAFDGVTQYFDTGLNPNTVMTLNTGYMVIYQRDNVSSAGLVMGITDAGGTTQWSFNPYHNTLNTARFNAYNSATLFSAANTNSQGRWYVGITASNARSMRKNEASIGTDATTVGGTLPNGNIYIGARNTIGTGAAAFRVCNLATVIQGLIGLDATNADILTLWVKEYNDNVISGGR